MSTPSGPACANCGTEHNPDDIFCESCGYDFITGSLPRPDEGFSGSVPGAPADPVSGPVSAPVSAASGPASGPGLFGPIPPAPSNGGPDLFENPPSAPTSVNTGTGAVTRFVITADRSYFEVVVAEGELEFPDPPPSPQDLEIRSEEIHLGRTSESRAIHPDLDIGVLTGDPAVSSRHAVIRRAPDGSLTVTDIGSTNGTFVGTVDSPAIGVGLPIPIDGGVPVYLGAWTRIVAEPNGTVAAGAAAIPAMAPPIVAPAEVAPPADESALPLPGGDDEEVSAPPPLLLDPVLPPGAGPAPSDLPPPLPDLHQA